MPYRLADTLQAKQPACLSAFPAPLMTNSSLTSHRVSFHHKKCRYHVVDKDRMGQWWITMSLYMGRGRRFYYKAGFALKRK